MLRRLTVFILTAGLALVGGTAAAAPTTDTQHAKGLVETFVDVLAVCADDASLYTITTTSNLVVHTTTFADGREHATFTQTGIFDAEPLDSTLPSYTGRFTVWGGFNANGKTANGTFTLSIRGAGSDGSRLREHSVDHFNVRPDGSVNEFFRCR